MKARAYMEAPPMSVILCANRLQDQAEMEEALVHELVHVVDVRTDLYIYLLISTRWSISDVC